MSELREACIILPTHEESGRHLGPQHETLVRDIVQQFHGVTVVNGYGSWINPQGQVIEEPVKIYTFAATLEDKTCRLWLRVHARQLLRTTQQQAIYIRHVTGQVEIIKKEGFQP